LNLSPQKWGGAYLQIVVHPKVRVDQGTKE